VASSRAGAGQVTAVLALTSAMFLLIFRYVFGGAIRTGSVAYADYFIPAMAAGTGLFASGAVGVAEDIESGLFDRLRSLPIPRATTLLGSAQAAQGMSFMAFPFVFVSSAYVPVHSMPGWMQPVAAHQPFTMMVGSVRALTLGNKAQAALGRDGVTRRVPHATWCCAGGGTRAS
jgi:ABC-type multidrug transport system permease subunit